jgi:hypothetical protein
MTESGEETKPNDEVADLMVPGDEQWLGPTTYIYYVDTMPDRGSALLKRTGMITDPVKATAFLIANQMLNEGVNIDWVLLASLRDKATGVVSRRLRKP